MNLKVKGTVRGEFRTGMIAGALSAPGAVINCRAEGSVICNEDNANRNGGIVGTDWVGYSPTNARTLISNCVFSGDVTVNGPYAGGIIGLINNGNIYGCVVEKGSQIKNTQSKNPEGDYSANGYIGGIAGMVNTKDVRIVSCISRATVEGASMATGGIAGCIDGAAYIINCVADGINVSGQDGVGGIVGDGSSGYIINCCASGAVAATGKGDSKDYYAGGLLGKDSHSCIINSFSSCAVNSAIKKGGISGQSCIAYNCCFTGTSNAFGTDGTAGSADIKAQAPMGAVSVLADPTELPISSSGSYQLKAYPGGQNATAEDVVSIDTYVSDANVAAATVNGTKVNITAKGPGSAKVYTRMWLKSRVAAEKAVYYTRYIDTKPANEDACYLFPNDIGSVANTRTFDNPSLVFGPTVAILADNSIVVPVTGVSLSDSALTIKKAQTASLTATIAPANATNRGIAWKSDNESIATATGNGDGCVVNAIAEGKANITATTSDGGFAATCAVTVTAQAVNPITSADYSYSEPQDVSCDANNGVTNEQISIVDDKASCDAEVAKVTEVGAGGDIANSFDGLTNPVSINVLSAFAIDVEGDENASGDLTLHVKLDDGITLQPKFSLYALMWPHTAGAVKFAAFPAEYDSATNIVTITIKEYRRFFSTSTIVLADVKTAAAPTPASGSGSSGGCSAGLGALELFSR